MYQCCKRLRLSDLLSRNAGVEPFALVWVAGGVLSNRCPGKPGTCGRDLFYGLWIPDLFMHRVEEDGEWSLMCPDQCPGLAECWGADFEELYTRYEQVLTSWR